MRLPDPSVAAAITARRARSQRLAGEAALKWKFWRWRPKCSLCTFQIAALCLGGIVLVFQHSVPWRPSVTLRGHVGKVATANFSSDGLSIVTAGEDGTARIWDADTGAQMKVLQHEKQMFNDREVPPAPFISSTFSPDNSKVATINADGLGTEWDSNSGKFVGLIRISIRSVAKTIHYSPDGKQFISFDDNGMVSMGPGTDIPDLETISIGSDCLNSATFTNDGKLIVTSTTNGVLQVWNLDGRLRGAMRGDVNFFRSPVFSSDGTTIATAGNDCSVRLWKATNNEDNKSILDPDPPQPNAGEAANQYHSRSWFVKPLKVMHGHSRYVNCTQFSPDGLRLVTVALDGSVRVWDGHDGELLAKLSESGPWRSAVFSPDGSRVCAAGIDGTVQIWDRRRTERWYGMLVFPELWLLVFVLTPALVWSIRRDRRSFIIIQSEV